MRICKEFDKEIEDFLFYFAALTNSKRLLLVRVEVKDHTKARRNDSLYWTANPSPTQPKSCKLTWLKNHKQIKQVIQR